MPWQALVAQVGLEHEGGRLVYKDVDVSCPRQQGKSSLVLSLSSTDAGGAGSMVVYGAQSRLAARRRLISVWWPRIRRSPLRDLFTLSKGTGRRLDRGERVAADAAEHRRGTAHGDVVDLGILDEAGRWMRPPSRR